MYNPLLQTFLTVADSGSFSKAASSLFISKVSVMKQIDSLETHFGFTLFIRGPRGIKLTPEGELVYQEARNIIRLSTQTLTQAKELSKQNRSKKLRIGTSFFRPIAPLVKTAKYSEPEILPVLIDDSQDSIFHIIRTLGSQAGEMPFDAIMSFALSPEQIKSCDFEPIAEYQPMFAVPSSSPLANSSSLSFDDICESGSFLLSAKGSSLFHDRLRSFIKESHPSLPLLECSDAYSAQKYITCIRENCITDALDLFPPVPGITYVPMRISFSVTYGILNRKK